jgi:hypothetical protein
LSTIASDEHGSAQLLASVLGAVKAFLQERGMVEVIQAEMVKLRGPPPKRHFAGEEHDLDLTMIHEAH